MGFFFRKSIKFGPIRLNLSKSGIGVSGGITGARISTGPRGTYVNLGRKGVYYRKKISIPLGANAPSHVHGSSVPPPPQTIFDSSGSPDIVQTETVDSDHLVNSSFEDALSEINRKLETPSSAPPVIVGMVILCLIIVGSTLGVGYRLFGPEAISTESKIGFIVLLVVLSFAFAVVWFGGIYLYGNASEKDKREKTSLLTYEFDEVSSARYELILGAVDALGNASRIWSQQTQQSTYDWKRNAGARALITRTLIRVGRLQLKGVITNIPVCGFDFGYMKLFFMPDKVFVLKGKRYGAISYDHINKLTSSERFIENESIPRDGKVIDYTWQYVNRNGGPDRRFKNNRQIPVMQYGVVELTASEGLHIHLQVSSLERTSEFATLSNQAWSKSTTEKQKTKPDLEWARKILDVDENVTLEELTAAYKRKAKQYHPDRVVGLGEEFGQLADARMKEINRAYEELKRKVSNKNREERVEPTAFATTIPSFSTTQPYPIAGALLGFAGILACVGLLLSSAALSNTSQANPKVNSAPSQSASNVSINAIKSPEPRKKRHK
jgi:hypothetical protein